MLTEHAELKTICDEHEDDLEDTVEFYRKVGGVQYVIPHPNVAPDEMLRCESGNGSLGILNFLVD